MGNLLKFLRDIQVLGERQKSTSRAVKLTDTCPGANPDKTSGILQDSKDIGAEKPVDGGEVVEAVGLGIGY